MMFLPEVSLVQCSRQHRNTRHQVEHGTYVYIRNYRPEARPSGEQQNDFRLPATPRFSPTLVFTVFHSSTENC